MRAREESGCLEPSGILKNLVKGPYSKRKVRIGLENMGMFQAQQLVHIVTLVDLTKDKNITNHIGVAVGNTTYERLMAMDPKFC